MATAVSSPTTPCANGRVSGSATATGGCDYAVEPSCVAASGLGAAAVTTIVTCELESRTVLTDNDVILMVFYRLDNIVGLCLSLLVNNYLIFVNRFSRTSYYTIAINGTLSLKLIAKPKIHGLEQVLFQGCLSHLCLCYRCHIPSLPSDRTERQGEYFVREGAVKWPEADSFMMKITRTLFKISKT